MKRRGVRPALARQVAERDNWMRQLCGLPIAAEAPSTHPLALTADHIVTVYDGGSDDLANLQAAHRLCNIRRRRDPIEVDRFRPDESGQLTPHDVAAILDSAFAQVQAAFRVVCSSAELRLAKALESLDAPDLESQNDVIHELADSLCREISELLEQSLPAAAPQSDE